jgi:SAM-dependent methyltransferase
MADRILPFATPQSFDMVMMHDVLEHLHDSPRGLVTQLTRLIRDGGFFFVTVPNAANIRKRLSLLRGSTNLPDFEYFYWLPSPWRGHVREYVRQDVLLLATYLGLQIREVRSTHHMLARIPERARPIYRAATAVFTGWRDTWVLVAQKPAGWVAPTIEDERLKAIRARVTPRTPVPER